MVEFLDHEPELKNMEIRNAKEELKFKGIPAAYNRWREDIKRYIEGILASSTRLLSS